MMGDNGIESVIDGAWCLLVSILLDASARHCLLGIVIMLRHLTPFELSHFYANVDYCVAAMT